MILFTKKIYSCIFLLLLAAMSTQAQPGALDLSFNPTDEGFGNGDGPNGTVSSIAQLPDGKILIAGTFTSFNGKMRNRVARLNADRTLDASYNNNFGTNFPVNSIALQPDGKLLIGGNFTSFDGTGRNHIARLNADGTLDETFNPGTGANGTINSVALQEDGKVLIGGNFTTYTGISRVRVARLNADGTLDATFDPGTGTNGSINVIVLQPDGKLLIGGTFTTFNAINRSRIARLDTDGTLDVTFNPGTGPNNSVSTIALQLDGKILIGGSFTNYNSISRNYIARLNTDATLDETFNPGTGANSSIFIVSVQSDGKLMIGGGFLSFNGISRNRIARLDAAGTVDETFNPGTGANSFVNAISTMPDGNMLIGGNFTTYDEIGQVRIALVNANGTLMPGIIVGTGANNSVNTIALQPDGKLLIGGTFTNFNGNNRNRIARLNKNGTLDESFIPGLGPDNQISALALLPEGKIMIGGLFTSYNGISRNNIARLNSDGTLDETFNPGTGANNQVNAIAIQPDGKLLIGGSFSSYNGTNQKWIARLNEDGTLDGTFSPGTGPNNIINAFVIQPDGKMLIGGAFNSFNGTTINRIARLNADGTLDETFNPGTGANISVNSIVLQPDGKIIIGGGFSIYNGIGRIRIARLLADGTLDETFNPGTGANNQVNAIALQPDGKILIAGFFTNFNGITQNRITRLNTDGTRDENYNAGLGAIGANNIVYAIVLQPDGNLLIGGSFTSYDGTGRNRIARLQGDITGNLWTGAVNNNWNEAGNWSSNTYPSPDGSYIVNSGYAQLNVDLDVTGSLTLGSTGVLYIAPGKTLTVASSGTVDFGNRPLIVHSNLEASGVIGQISGTLIGATDVIVQRFIPQAPTMAPQTGRAWRLLSMPVTSATATIRDAWAGGSFTRVNNQSNGMAEPNQFIMLGEGTIITGHAYPTAETANAAGYDWWPELYEASAVPNEPGKGAASGIRRYRARGNTGDWPSNVALRPVINTTLDNTDPAYMLFVRGDRTVAIGSSSTLLAPRGNLRVGDVTQYVPASTSSKFLVYGNPYAATLDFEKLYDDNAATIKQVMHIWDATLPGTNNLGGYRVITKVGPNWVDNISGATSDVQLLHSSQGVMLESNTLAGGTLTTKEAHKIAAQPFIYPFEVDENAVPGLLNANLNRVHTDGSLLLVGGVSAIFAEGLAITTNDKYDLGYLESFTGNLGMALSNSNSFLAFEGRPVIKNNDKLNLHITGMGQANYAVVFKGKDMGFEGGEAFLIDKFLGTETKIALDGAATQYAFSGTSEEASKSTDRFEIVFKQSNVLPVTFTNITARELRGDIQVSWSVATEDNMSHYEVEHSRNGSEFGKAVKVDAKNLSPASYAWLHVQPGVGEHFYRVRAINLEGRSLTTRVVKVIMGSKGNPAFRVFPTIVSQTRNVTVHMTAMEKGNYTMQVIDMGGKVISSNIIEHMGGSSSMMIQLPPSLNTGKYNIRLTGASGNFVQPVVKD